MKFEIEIFIILRIQPLKIEFYVWKFVTGLQGKEINVENKNVMV